MTPVTTAMNFYQNHDPAALVAEYGSPLYVYSERIFRKCCRDMVGLTSYPRFKVNYAIKANTNLSLLRIAKEEGLAVDISSPGTAPRRGLWLRDEFPVQPPPAPGRGADTRKWRVKTHPPPGYL